MSHILKVEYRAAPPDWDDWLRAQGPHAGFCQTSFWAEISRVTNGVDNHWLEVKDEGGRAAGALLSRRRPNLKDMSAADNARVRLSGMYSGWLDCFEGPVLTGTDKRGQLDRMLERIDALAAETGVREVRFHGPPANCDWAGEDDVLNAFRDLGYVEEPYLTTVIALAPPEEELFSGFKHAARKGIRKCEQHGVQVLQCRTREAFLQDFRRPYYDAMAVPPDEARALAMWDIDGGRHYRFFVAKDAAGRVLATLGTYSFNGLATEIMSHRTKESFKHNLPAQDLLHWEIFKAHKAAGDTGFNLAGYSLNAATPKQAGIRRFKEKWGGREVSVPKFVKRFPSLSQRAWRLLKMRRSGEPA